MFSDFYFIKGLMFTSTVWGSIKRITCIVWVPVPESRPEENTHGSSIPDSCINYNFFTSTTSALVPFSILILVICSISY